MATKKKAAGKKAPAKAAKKATASAAGAKGLYGEISTATATPAKDKETQSDYAVRVCQVISEMTDDNYGKLSKPAQDWFDKTVELINAEKVSEIAALSAAVYGYAKRRECSVGSC